MVIMERSIKLQPFTILLHDKMFHVPCHYIASADDTSLIPISHRSNIQWLFITET